jgi:anti-sigma28 factor (negative regulator of flagellin synthesis)
MKITGNDIERIHNTVIPEKNTAERKTEKRTETINDRVVLSDKAKDYSPEKNLVQSVVNDTVKQTSSKKLLQLKDDIAKGKYHISGEEIAAAIIDRNKNNSKIQ